MSEHNTFYITTPIYYPSDKLHIGHSTGQALPWISTTPLPQLKSRG